MKVSFVLLYSMLLFGCATYTDPVSEDFTGETANISDSYIGVGRGGAKFFYIDKVNGKSIRNSLSSSASLSYGQGANLTIDILTREIPSEALVLNAVAKTYYAAPILGMFGENLKHERVFEIHPEAGVNYLIRGVLTKKEKQLWIEGSNEESNEERREDTAEAANHNQLLTKYTSFSELKKGISSELVISRLGKPDLIININSADESPAQQDYLYYDVGTVRFQNVSGEFVVEKAFASKKTMKQELLVLEAEQKNSNNQSEERDQITPSEEIEEPQELQKAVEDYDELVEKLSRRIESENGARVQSFSKLLYSKNPRDRDVLDRVARKVWLERNNKDKYMEDGVAYLCMTLMNSIDGRYKQFLGKVLKESSSRKIKKYARRAYDALPQTSEEPFSI